MAEPEVNVPLLRKAVEWVESQAALPEIDREWRQGSWITAPHSKGWLLFHNLSSYMPVMPVMNSRETDDKVEQIAEHCGTAYCVAGYVAQLKDKRYVDNEFVDGIHSSAFARVELGLTEEQSHLLFQADNSAERIREIATEIVGGDL